VRFISPVVAEFLALYPAVSVDLRMGEQMIDLIEGGFDLAINALSPPESSLIVRRLTPWRHILCCAPAYLQTHEAPASLADLAGHNCLRYAYYAFGEEWRFVGPDGKPESVKVSGNILSTSGELLRFLALNGSGVLLAPSFVVAEDMETGRLVQLLPDHHPVPFAINAVYPHRHHLTTKVRRFLDLLVERFEHHRRWMDPDQAV
jgi:DNA-binding transcriptional LysR family regulator